MPTNIFRLVVAVLICEGAGIIGSLFSTPSIQTWYASLVKPSFNPPNWLFGPVWTLLFLLMGISAYIIWSKGLKSDEVKIALIIFGVQLLLNVVWSVLFFGLHMPLVAFIEIIFLWLSILATILYFLPISSLAAWLLVPYILWVSFASILNFFLWRLNI